MIDRVDGERALKTGSSIMRRWPLLSGTLLAMFVLVIAGLAGGPYIFQGATIEGEIAKQLRATTGLAFSTAIPGRFDLLPRPHIVMGASRIADPTGAFNLECEALEGDVRLLPLIVGKIELVSATFTRPHLAIDLDSRPIRADSLIGQALHATQPLKGGDEQRLGILTFIDGSATLKSKGVPRIPELKRLNMTLDWRDLDSPATLTGSLSAGATTTDLAIWISQPSNLMRGDHSAVALRVRSEPIDLSANGDLASTATTAFHGHISAKSPSIASLLTRFDIGTKLLAPFENVVLDSEADVVLDAQAQMAIDLHTLTLRADGNDYEGTLAFQSGARPALSGTLASGKLLLAPFLSRLPQLLAVDQRWSSEPILAKKPQLLDLDLRISATHLRLAPLMIDDAALAVITRGDRTEVALVGGKAYGGTAHGRFSIGTDDGGVSLRGSGSLQDADASALSWDALGRQVATGTLAASVNLEAIGGSPMALMRSLRGWAKGSITDGELSGVDIGRGLRGNGRQGSDGDLVAMRGGRTPFTRITFDVPITEGVATMDESFLSGSDANISLGGTADIGTRSLSIVAVATTPSSATPTSGKIPPGLRFDLSGWLDKPFVKAKAAVH